MRTSLIWTATCLSLVSATARAQVDLSTYVDANGFINVQALTCAQLANTWQQDADMLTTWYSGWYNGLAKSTIWICVEEKNSNTRSFCTARHTRRFASSMRSPSSSKTNARVSVSK
jgi:hypothetical protein